MPCSACTARRKGRGTRVSSSPTSLDPRSSSAQPPDVQPRGAPFPGSPPSSGWIGRDRQLHGAFAICVLLIAYQLAVTFLQPSWSRAVTDWLRTALAWVALVVVAYVSWWCSRARRPDAPAWWLVTAALLSYAIARTLWTVEDVFIFHHGVPFPIVSDLFFALQYPFFFVAIILIPRRRPSTSRVILILDYLLWMGAALTLSWFFMLAPIVTESDLSPLAKEIALSYPVGDLFVLLGLTVTLLRAPHSRGHAPVLGILIAAFACLIVGDNLATFDVLQPAHAYMTGGFPDLFWLSFYLLLPLAALVQLRISQHDRAVKWDVARHKPDHEDHLWRDIKASLPVFLPIVAALLASMVLTIGAIVRAAESGWQAQVWPITAIFSLLLLVFMRQAIISLDQERLRREMAVTQEKERATIELNRRKDEFLGVVSHEIRTPLTTLRGNIYLLVRRFNIWWPRAAGAAVHAPPSPSEVERGRALLASCEEGLERLTRLADDLTDHTRIRDGKFTLYRAPCDLRALVRTAVEAQRAAEPNRVINLLPSSAPSAAAPHLVDVDADRIVQVITNYLSNALKYSKADQPVAVMVEEGEDSQAHVAVRDAGPGLAEAEQARVWERYPRIETVAVQSGSGVSLGLGLSISKEIIERHGGEVGVESTPGAGSTFWFTLPLLVPPAITSP